MKKTIGYVSILIINYLLISLIVFIFSLVSLKNGKVYDLLWIKYVQTTLYFKTSFRNVFQHSTNDCVEYDEDLIYVPKKENVNFLIQNLKQFLVSMSIEDLISLMMR